jgi:peptidoglycan L-alanyl-D-glutamate endopeptidase CwlK
MEEKEIGYIRELGKHTLHIVTVITFGAVIMGSLITSSPPTNNGIVQAVEIVPLPTEINENFLKQVNECFLPTTSAYGYTLRISSGFRTLEEQDQLFEQGRTVDGHIVTDAPGGKSIHNYGYAIDIVDRWREYFINFEKLGKIATYCGLEQGHDGDLAHFEHRAGLTTEEFSQGKRPPLLKLPCSLMAERAANKQPFTKKDLQNCGAPEF